MKPTARLAIVCGAAAAAAALFAGPAAASPAHQPAHTPVQQPAHQHTHRSAHVVFVQNDNLDGNTVVAYDRAPDGTLTQAGVYPTGGLGGQLTGSVADHTASQGALAYDSANDLLYAVKCRQQHHHRIRRPR